MGQRLGFFLLKEEHRAKAGLHKTFVHSIRGRYSLCMSSISAYSTHGQKAEWNTTVQADGSPEDTNYHWSATLHLTFPHTTSLHF